MHTHNFHQITLNDLKLNLFLVLSPSLSQSWTGWPRRIRKLMGRGGKDPFPALGVIWLKMRLLNPILFFWKWIYVLRFADVSVKMEFVPWPSTAFLIPWVEKDAPGVGFPWIFTSSTITFTLFFQHLQTEDMEKAEKLRPAQSLPFLCHSPRSIPEHGAVPLRKSVSVSELVARWVAILQLQMTVDLWSSPGWSLLPPCP